MTKPLGLSMFPLGVVKPTRAEDAIWDAVEEAIAQGMTPTQFKREAASAWDEQLRRAAKDAVKELL